MRIVEISYSMLRKTDDFENDRASVTIQLDPEDDVGAAALEAKATCRSMLGVVVDETDSPPSMQSVPVSRGRHRRDAW